MIPARSESERSMSLAADCPGIETAAARWRECVLLALALQLGPSCTGREDEAPARDQPRGVILISIDTLRADHLGCYGYERATSPAIDGLAARGALFEDVVSSAPWTVPAHMSMLTGLYPRSHGVDAHGKVLPEETLTLAEHLAAQGFATAAVVNGPMLARKNFASGFQQYDFVPTRGRGRPEPTLPVGSHAVEILARARSWLAENRARRFFLFLHIYDVHTDFEAAPAFRAQFERPYDGVVDGTSKQLHAYLKRTEGEPDWGPEDARHLVDLYDAEIRQIDGALGEFFAHLESSGLARETALVLTSDHGEEFLEHGGVLHGPTLHREALHVPLLVAGPGIPRGARFRGEASPVDLFPTLARMLGVSAPPGLEGIDLAAAWREPAAWPAERAVFAEARNWPGMEEGDFRGSIRAGPWTLHFDKRTGGQQLFQLEQDPAELHDASRENPDLVRRLQAELDAFLASARAPLEAEPLGKEELQALQALGYQ
jgi:arylsulfatase A-like enzyme